MSVSKTILMILILSFISCTANAQYLREQKLKQDISLSKDSSQKLTEKSPVLAGTLSLIVPGFGFGQLYNGETGKFLTHSIISAACITTFLITARYAGFPVSGESHENRANLGGVLVFLSVITFAGNYVISVADATVSALNINKKIRLQNKRSDILNNLRLGLSVDKDKKLKFKLALAL